MKTAVFKQDIKDVGTIELFPFDLTRDGKVIYQWVQQPYAVYWGLIGKSYEEFEEEYLQLLKPKHYNAYTGYLNGQPVFLMEQYDPAQDLLAQHIKITEGDTGMHLLVAPPKSKITNFTWHVFSTVLNYIFSQSRYQRIVVEPDARNEKIHQLNKKAGFVYQKTVQLPHKKAALATCTKKQFEKAQKTEIRRIKGIDYQPNKVVWELVNKQLLAKAISEFSHERLFAPVLVDDKVYRIEHSADNCFYFFEAKKYALSHWEIDAKSIRKIENGETKPIFAIDFILQFQNELGIPHKFLATYLEEITSTLYSKAYKLEHESYKASELIHQDFQSIEQSLTEGHPCFVANSGRLGFSNTDFEKYAPEAHQKFQLIWLAGANTNTYFTAVKGVNYHQLMTAQLSKKELTSFVQKLIAKGLNPSDYTFIPVHPWQWENKISIGFAQDIANDKLVYLGVGEDNYVAQQSIRTLFNKTTPQKHYTKTAMSILNMGFVRGLSPHYMRSTPPITEWINKLLAKDKVLSLCGFEMLDEVATVGYVHNTYKAMGHRHANNKMLAGLWRESPLQKLKEGEKAMSMAALLHRDNEGQSFVKAMILASGLETAEWVKAYLKAYLRPLLHCLYAHKLVFMPHGENIILKIKEHVPTGIFMKDITEEVLYFDTSAKVNEHVQRLVVDTSFEMQALSIQTDVFDCIFRFLGTILERDLNFLSAAFWHLVRDEITRYQSEHPQFEARYKEVDLLEKEFKLCCLNRLQLSNTKQMLDLSDPINTLKMEGYLENPLYKIEEPTVH